MNTTLFLGANTPQGFYSYFDRLPQDRAVRQTVILKGGAGCGKSTFMKTLRRRAQQLGADTASFLCSSDPQSLDGLLIVPLGLAFVDGTAPHTLEPSLCCCDAVYLNLGAFYDAERVRAHAPALRLLQGRNRACYRQAYAYLQAAGCYARLQRAQLRDSSAEQLRQLARATARSLNPEPEARRRLFLRSFTPDGLVLPEGTLDRFVTRIALHDPYGLSGLFLEAVLTELDGAAMVCDAPLDPGGTPDALLLPGSSTALYTAPAQNAPTPGAQIDLAPFVSDPAAAQALARRCADAQQQAVAQLAEARRIHDQIEALYRPYVDFAGLDLLTQGYVQQLERQLLPQS